MLLQVGGRLHLRGFDPSFTGMVQFDLPVFKRQRVRGADGQRFPRLALRHLVEDDEEGFGRAEFQFEAARR